MSVKVVRPLLPMHNGNTHGDRAANARPTAAGCRLGQRPDSRSDAWSNAVNDTLGPVARRAFERRLNLKRGEMLIFKSQCVTCAGFMVILGSSRLHDKRVARLLCGSFVVHIFPYNDPLWCVREWKIKDWFWSLYLTSCELQECYGIYISLCVLCSVMVVWNEIYAAARLRIGGLYLVE